MAFPVLWLSSLMEGAPMLSAGTDYANQTPAAGDAIAYFKQLLISGFGTRVVQSAAYNSTDSTITFTFLETHKYLKHSVIEVSGAADAAFNGKFRIKATATYTVTVGLDNGTPASASTTGTITIKYPGLGWTIAFEDAATFRIIFKRADPTATGVMLLIDNSAWTGWTQNGGSLMKVMLVEDVVDINTYSLIAERRWPASHSYSKRGWEFFADAKMIYWLPQYGNTSRRSVYAYGDIITVRPGDNYHTILTHYSSNTVINAGSDSWTQGWNYVNNNFPLFNNGEHRLIARSYHQLVGAVAFSLKSWQGSFGEGLSFPNPADNGFYVSKDPIPVFDDLSLRGYMPGLMSPYASPGAYDCTNLANLPAIPNKIIRLVGTTRNASSSDPGFRLFGFDIVGPWR